MEKLLLSSPVTPEMAFTNVKLTPLSLQRIEEIRDYLEEKLDRTFSIDKIVNIIIEQVEFKGMEL